MSGDVRVNDAYDCQNCGARMTSDDPCPECPHDPGDPRCDCAYCESLREESNDH